MTQIRARIGEGGRLVIPAGYRKALGIIPGDEVVMILEEGELRLLTLDKAVQYAQELVRRYVPKERDLVAELLRERREEAASE